MGALKTTAGSIIMLKSPKGKICFIKLLKDLKGDMAEKEEYKLYIKDAKEGGFKNENEKAFCVFHGYYLPEKNVEEEEMTAWLL